MTQQQRTVSPLVGEMTLANDVVLVIGSGHIVSAIAIGTAAYKAMALLRMMPITAYAHDIG